MNTKYTLEVEVDFSAIDALPPIPPDLLEPLLKKLDDDAIEFVKGNVPCP